VVYVSAVGADGDRSAFTPTVVRSSPPMCSAASSAAVAEAELDGTLLLGLLDPATGRAEGVAFVAIAALVVDAAGASDRM
jgi:hypothetical protein